LKEGEKEGGRKNFRKEEKGGEECNDFLFIPMLAKRRERGERGKIQKGKEGKEKKQKEQLELVSVFLVTFFGRGEERKKKKDLEKKERKRNKGTNVN